LDIFFYLGSAACAGRHERKFGAFQPRGRGYPG
jgi:hypothetical protein